MTKRSAILGIGGLLGHDANAALLLDGRVVASAQEERFTRRKHDAAFPRRAIADCLAQGAITADEVTDVVFAEKAVQTHLHTLTRRSSSWLSRTLGYMMPASWGTPYGPEARRLFPRARQHHAWHHLAHVAGAFHTSPFARAAFLCVDGKGEDYSATLGIIAHDRLQLLWEQPYENGLGMFYTLLTQHLGFTSFGSEYKVMGLAPYGEPRWLDRLRGLFVTDDRGGFRLRRELTFNAAGLDQGVDWIAAELGLPARGPAEPLEPAHLDLAASLQRIFEEEILNMARFLRRETGEENVLFCGGCAQNCVAAGRLRRAGIFPRVFNSPVGGDMGSAFGATLLLERERRCGERVEIDARGFLLGSEPGPSPAEAQPYRVAVEGDGDAFLARELASGKTVAVVRGRMELGARALGARSILADPRVPGMQSHLNRAVKFRESFRPFAPAILAEYVGNWFDSTEESDYMNYTASLRPELRQTPPSPFATLKERLDFPRCTVPSVIHVDFSARLQTVRASVHPEFHRLLTAFHALTGTPILINTSFNVSGQPIVRTAAEGWECFVNTDLDLLVLNQEVFRNPARKTREEKLAWLAQFSAQA